VYRTTDARLWTDDKVRRLSHNAFCHLLGLLAHPELTLAGTLSLPFAELARDMHCSTFRTRKALRELHAIGILFGDFLYETIWFPNFLRYHIPNSSKVARGVQRVALRVRFSSPAIRDHFLSTTREHLRAFPTLSWETISAPISAPVSEAVSVRVSEATTDPKETDEQGNKKHRSLTVAVTRAREATAESEAAPTPHRTAEPTPATTDEPKAGPLNGSTAPPSVTAWGAMPTRKRLGRMAWEARRVGLSVPAHLHAELLSKMAQPADERALVAFYGRVEDELGDAPVGEDVHDFWRNHFHAWQGTNAPTARDRKRRALEDEYQRAKKEADDYERAQRERASS